MRVRSHFSAFLVSEIRFDDAVRKADAQFGYDLLERRCQRLILAQCQRQSAAKSTAGEVEHVIDEAGHAAYAFPHDADHPFAQDPEERLSRARMRRSRCCQRIAQVVAQHCDELFAKVRGLAFVG